MESHQPVNFPSCGSIKAFLETITILLGFDSFVDDAVVGEQSELAEYDLNIYLINVITDNETKICLHQIPI